MIWVMKCLVYEHALPYGTIFFADANVPIKSKLKHPPPEAEKLFNCPIVGPFQMIKCPHSRGNFSVASIHYYYKFTVVYRESVNLIAYIIVCYLLIVNTYASVHIARHLWAWCNIIKQFFSMCYLTFFLFIQWDYGKYILKQLDYSPLFSMSDSQLGCASLTICS